MTAAYALSDTDHMAETNQVTTRELARHTTGVLERVAAGETIEVTRNGKPVALITAPDPVDVTTYELVAAGIIPPDLLERQATTLGRVRKSRTPMAKGQKPLSETIIEMRDEERT
jgi:prevent-host-death family protein